MVIPSAVCRMLIIVTVGAFAEFILSSGSFTRCRRSCETSDGDTGEQSGKENAFVYLVWKKVQRTRTSESNSRNHREDGSFDMIQHSLLDIERCRFYRNEN